MRMARRRLLNLEPPQDEEERGSGAQPPSPHSTLSTETSPVCDAPGPFVGPFSAQDLVKCRCCHSFVQHTAVASKGLHVAGSSCAGGEKDAEVRGIGAIVASDASAGPLSGGPGGRVICVACSERQHLEQQHERYVGQQRQRGWIWQDVATPQGADGEGAAAGTCRGGWWKKIIPFQKRARGVEDDKELGEADAGDVAYEMDELGVEGAEGAEVAEAGGGGAGHGDGLLSLVPPKGGDGKQAPDLSWIGKHIFDAHGEQCCEICFSAHPETLDAQGNLLPPEDRNEMVFCSRCDILVHQACYGGEIANGLPEGDWICQACKAGLEQVECVLCPVPHGPVKRTDGSQPFPELSVHFFFVKFFYKKFPSLLSVFLSCFAFSVPVLFLNIQTKTCENRWAVGAHRLHALCSRD